MMKFIILFLTILLDFHSLKAQESCKCDIIFEKKPLPKNLFLAQLKDSLKFSDEIKFILSKKHSYGFEYALFYFNINKNGSISGLRLSADPKLSDNDRAFLELLRKKLESTQWHPARYRHTGKRSALTFGFNVEAEQNRIEVLINDETHDRVLFNKIYTIN